jgi:hypothetical protein
VAAGQAGQGRDEQSLAAAVVAGSRPHLDVHPRSAALLARHLFVLWVLAAALHQLLRQAGRQANNQAIQSRLNVL